MPPLEIAQCCRNVYSAPKIITAQCFPTCSSSPKWFPHKFQRFTSDLLSRHHFICFPPPDKSFCRATSCSLKALLCRQYQGDTTCKYTTMLELNIWCASIIWLHICVRFRGNRCPHQCKTHGASKNSPLSTTGTNHPPLAKPPICPG